MTVLVWCAERSLRRDMEGDIARGLESEAGLIREALPADSLGWTDAVHRLSQQNNHRITLIDLDRPGARRQRFPARPAPVIENHAGRPEVRAALHGRIGVAEPAQRDRRTRDAVRRRSRRTGHRPGGGRA